jgi:hypothetical protein
MPNPIELQKTLSGVHYPTDKNDLVEHAKKNGADEDILNSLNKIPDKEYTGPDQVQKEVF